VVVAGERVSARAAVEVRRWSEHAQQIILRFMGLILVAIGGDMILGGVEQSAHHFFLGANPPAH
jgi:small neutral amino acid transporter SnatA (MarC family)